MESIQPGTLYVVSTPIGNYHDMSPRGIEILNSVDMIAAEDTRRTMILLNKLGIRNNLTSNHNYNEFGRKKQFIEQLKQGKSVAIVTDAGTPCISDPGNILIKEAINENIKVVGIPGCCAAINALVVSGFDWRSFLFCGFFPRENSEKIKALDKMRHEPQTRTFVFYESPKRIMKTMEFLIENNVMCSVSLSNDMTKRYEITFRGSPIDVKTQLEKKGNYEKGEYVLIIELQKEYMITHSEHIFSAESFLVDVIVQQGCTMKEAIKQVLENEMNTYSKNELYSAGLHLKELFNNSR